MDSRPFREALIDRFCKKAFMPLQSFGLHIVPNHFYQPIPDTRELQNEIWQKKSSLCGIDINEGNQLDLLSEFARLYKEEYEQIPKSKTNVSHQYYIDNESFGSIDGEILYCMIRHFKPRRVIEIGSGNSTLLSAQATIRNQSEGYPCNLISIEPYPNRIIAEGFPGLSRLIPKRAQDVPLAEFMQLEANDILFIDSSHVVKTGSDALYEYLEIIPRLAPGVLVHAHDIFLPMEYPRHWLFEDHHFWNEQYILQAFLTHNVAWKVLWAGYYMHVQNPAILEQMFSSYSRKKGCPRSFWIKRTI
jgi:hypothetical protein